MKAELAEMESYLGHKEEAYRLICEALENRQDDKFKLRSFEILADLALDLGKPAVAAAHVTLAGAIRTKEGWKKPVPLEELERRTHTALTEAGKEWPELPDDLRELSRYCRLLRVGEQKAREEKVAPGVIGKSARQAAREIPGVKTGPGGGEEGGGGHTNASLERRQTGTIIKIDPDRPFTFIKPDGGGEAIFVALRDLPPECARAGNRVTFQLEESFDRKKNRASVRAVAVKVV
jgi:cold shock CspA family protein